jgi:hypothetical protein
MADFLRVEFQDGKIAFIVTGPDALADIKPGAPLRTFTGPLRNASGTVTIQAVGSRFQHILLNRVDGDKSINDEITLNVGSVRITHNVVIARKTANNGVLQTPGQQLMLTISTRPDEGTVFLRVTEGGPDTRPVADLTENSFAALWVRHPDQVRQYVMPLFQSLDLEGLFHVNAAQANRVLSPILKGLPDFKSQVEALLPRLNDDLVPVRAAALRELDDLGLAAVPIVSALDLKSQPLQTRVTLRGFLERMKDSHAVADTRLENPDFLLLCLAVDDPQIPALAKKQLEKITGQPLDFDVNGSLADRQAAVEKLRLAALAKPVTP